MSTLSQRHPATLRSRHRYTDTVNSSSIQRQIQGQKQGQKHRHRHHPSAGQSYPQLHSSPKP
jgi:hypothetical protein